MHSIRKLLPRLSRDLSLDMNFPLRHKIGFLGIVRTLAEVFSLTRYRDQLVTLKSSIRSLKPRARVFMALFGLLVAYSLRLLRRPRASEFQIFTDARKGRIWRCQDPVLACCNCIMFIIVGSWMDGLSNSITHDYFLLLPCKLDKTLISPRTGLGRGLSFSAPHTVLRENVPISKNTRLVLFKLLL